MKNKIMLTPTYTEGFECIGSKCEDTCCRGWHIYLDKKIYKLYNKLDVKKLNVKVDKVIKRNRKCKSDWDYGEIILDKNRRCPFLSKENLCGIYTNFGQDKMSEVCSIYPRKYNKIDHIIEKTLTLSCPEVAKRVLLNKNSMEFNEIECTEEVRNINVSINTQISGEYLSKYFWNLRIFTINLLQNRNYSIDDRLIILGMFYNEIQDTLDKNNFSNILTIIEKYEERILSSIYKEVLTKIKGDERIKIIFLQQLIGAKINIDESSKEFIDLHNNSIKSLDYNKLNGTSNYNKCYEIYYKPFFKDREYILENYLVNYVFANVFPLGKNKVFEDYSMLITYYSIIKIYLVGLSSYYKEDFSDQEVVNFIQKFYRFVMHDSGYNSWILDTLKSNNINNMAHMALFIRD
ncbi:flagellin lysine-N-methylase [Clostridium niameyense]|uniref:flagellin lysine-N-methylase n=1 Tax=Clostridium niameyense TaxID=1622073 RepID=UPI00067E9704|nr:flagellin lysine-N-methylase [Clostridium niameyense]